MKSLSHRFLLALVFVGACASLPPAKDVAIVGLQASEVALGAAQDNERALCFVSPQIESGPHCTNPIAAGAGLTDARHQSARDGFIAAFGVQKRAATALQLWQPGQPAPSDVASYQAALTQILNIAKVLDPNGQAFLDKAQSAVDEAAKAATAVGVK